MPDDEVKLSREAGFLPASETPETVEIPTVDSGMPPQQEVEMPAMASQPVGEIAPMQEQPANTVQHHEAPKDELLEKVESVMSRGLMDVYKEMSADKQAVFKTAGEEAAKRIREMLASGKPRRYTTMKLLGTWLKTIPKVNRYFLEQEVKLKTDDIQDLAA